VDLVRDRRHMQRLAAAPRAAGQRLGFVPTMGALHEGHVSLIAASHRRCDVTIVSIFVNPTQFGPGEDYRRYPRTFTRDAALCRKAGADLLFVPSVNDIYPSGDTIRVDAGPLGGVLEGASRPGHFNGVATVVLKLLDRDIPALLERRRMTPNAMLIDGDRAAVFGKLTASRGDIGRKISYRIAQFVRFENAKVVEYMSIIDSFDAVEQVLGQQLPLPTGARAGNGNLVTV